MAKKKSNGEGSVTKRADGKYMGQVTVGRDPQNGKLKRKTVYGKTKKEVQEKLNKLKYELQIGSYIDNSDKLTVNTWILRWLNEYKKGQLGQGTFDNYESYINNHVIPNIGEIELSKLTTDHIQKLYNKLGENGNVKTGKGLTGKTIRRIHILIHAALGQAMNNGYITKNVSYNVKLPKEINKEMQSLSIEEVNKFLTSCQDDRLYVAFLLVCNTGLRRGELLALRWRDIDFENGKLYVRQAIKQIKNRDENDDEKLKLVFGEPKTEKSKRSIPLSQASIDELIIHRKNQTEEKLKIGEYYQDNDLVFSNIDGTPIRSINFSNYFRTLLKKLEIKDVRFHDIRHTVASILLELNEHPKVVQELLGHSNISTTLNIYIAI